MTIRQLGAIMQSGSWGQYDNPAAGGTMTIRQLLRNNFSFLEYFILFLQTLFSKQSMYLNDLNLYSF